MTIEISLEAAQASANFVRLADIAGIAIDLRYDSTNNFVNRNVYAPSDCAWLHTHAAHALATAQLSLATAAPGHQLLVLDALRPHRVQIALWNSLQGTGLEQYLANPSLGSIHSFGMAVDVTVKSANGELDMGTGFDAMQEESHPEHEAASLARGSLNTQHIANRNLLRAAMQGAGFQGIKTEWWHFDFGDKALVRSSYARVA